MFFEAFHLNFAIKSLEFVTLKYIFELNQFLQLELLGLKILGVFTLTDFSNFFIRDLKNLLHFLRLLQFYIFRAFAEKL